MIFVSIFMQTEENQMNQSNRTNIDLPTGIHDARNSLNYTLHGDYYLPDITAESGKPLGKYGRARLRYLKEHRSNIYTRLLLTGNRSDRHGLLQYQ